MELLAPRWAVLGGLGVMLRHVGGNMVTKIARMSQHRRQGANPRGFEGSAGALEASSPGGTTCLWYFAALLA